MLRLEKAKNRDFRITFHKTRTIFTSAFLKGLSIALILHLGAFLLINIHTLLSSKNEKTIPIMAVADLHDGNSSVANSSSFLIEVPEWLVMVFSEPRIVNSEIKANVWREDSTHLAWLDASSIAENNWGHLEKINTPITPEFKPVEIRVSGALAECGMIKEDIKRPLPKVASGAYMAVFDVRVDNSTGELFWHSLKQGTGNSLLNQYAENILTQLRFEIEGRSSDFSLGEIEIAFHVDKGQEV